MSRSSGLPSSILQWAIAHSDPAALAEMATHGQSPEPGQGQSRESLDPKWIEAVLGEPDAVKIKQQLNRLAQNTPVKVYSRMQVVGTVDTVAGSQGIEGVRNTDFLEEELNNDYEMEFEEDVNDRVHALDQLEALCEIIDNANDLPKMGGVEILLKQLDNDSDDVKAHTLNLFAACLNNNPHFQQIMINRIGYNVDGSWQNSFVNILLDNLSIHCVNSVRAKALLALSAFLRNYEPAVIAFVTQDGPKRLAYMLAKDQNENLRFTRRLLFVFSYLLDHIPYSLFLRPHSLLGYSSVDFDEWIVSLSSEYLRVNFDLEIQERWLQILQTLLLHEPSLSRAALSPIVAGCLQNVNPENIELFNIGKEVLSLLLSDRVFPHFQCYSGLQTDLAVIQVMFPVDFFLSRRSFESEVLCHNFPPIFKGIPKAALYQFAIDHFVPSSSLIFSLYNVLTHHFSVAKFDKDERVLIESNQSQASTSLIVAAPRILFPSVSPTVTFRVENGIYHYGSQEAGSFIWHLYFSSKNSMFADYGAKEIRIDDIPLFEHPALLCLHQALLKLVDNDVSVVLNQNHESRIGFIVNAQRLLNIDSDWAIDNANNILEKLKLDQVNFSEAPWGREFKHAAPVTISHFACLPPLIMPTAQDIVVLADGGLNFSHSWWHQALDVFVSAFDGARKETDFAGTVHSNQGSTNQASKKRPLVIIHGTDYLHFTGTEVSDKWRSATESALCLLQLLSALIVEGITEFVYHAPDAYTREVYDRSYSLLYTLLLSYRTSGLIEMNQSSDWIALLVGIHLQ